MTPELRLNLGCGQHRATGWTGVDLFEGPAVDVIHNLDVGPWPWEAGSVAAILARHIFEHVNDAPLFMAECHRILTPGGKLYIETPHWKSRDAYTDPTHKRFPTEHTFDYWVKDRPLRVHHGGAYGGIEFDYQRPPEIVGGTLQVTLVRL
jgi:predicted SAM-dependent methyltransferase